MNSILQFAFSPNQVLGHFSVSVHQIGVTFSAGTASYVQKPHGGPILFPVPCFLYRISLFEGLCQGLNKLHPFLCLSVRSGGEIPSHELHLLTPQPFQGCPLQDL